ncbi:acyl-CoA carboxylase subunit beta [Levilinea saccharolytica]|uniref:Methylmalonyl-CoA carboxyltransferase n=1 Tax=Levilinea saccharolytica TaxID=229921 RepID=A0A0P6Y2Y1_9CHLR|nr:acyl-CoA carboxylase subunit beta [Levilinea saccharolytica]KPL83508.1 methylmalonyl-CoA carboxyltransferase [Levilinea saccharolytica]GAP18297.1 propionyl-CoA carboxylase carboxyltransferase subunit [Levilinea saccharolytica]
MSHSAFERLQQLRREAAQGGGPQRTAAQHAKGKLTARERIETLLDPGTFVETGMFVTHRAVGLGMEQSHPLGDGVVTGSGKIDGRPVYVFAQDFTVLGGSVGEAHAQKIARLQDLAFQNGAPLIGINDSGGARIQEGVASLAGYGEIFFRNVRASGVIPQISVILGPCAGGAVYSPAITDFVFMVENTANMFITGPEVIRAVTHQDITPEDLGGAAVHSTRSGVAHFTAPDEDSLFQTLRWLLSYLPSNNLSLPAPIPTQDPAERATPELAEIVPADPQRPYDIHRVLEVLLDDGVFLEVQPEYARNIVIGLGRLNGSVVGVIANQPDFLAGVLDIDASDKAARFIRFCDAFHIPLLTLVDTPGFLPGADQEHNGIIRHGAKMIFAYAEATVPKLSVILRKAYGGAYIVMSSKHLGGDLNLAWPNAEIAVMGPEGAVNIVFRKEIEASSDPAARRSELTQQYRQELANPFVAASRGYLDDILQPAETRQRLITGLDSLREKRQPAPARKHGNIPL